jgi:uncharacterized spore protein YtfJ
LRRGLGEFNGIYTTPKNLNMVLSVKTLGGVGYVLALIPLVNVVSPILIGIAWLRMGSATGQGVFRRAGIFMIASFAVLIALLAMLSTLLLPLLGVIMGFGAGDLSSILNALNLFGSSPLTFGLLGSAFALLGLALVAVVVTIIAFVLELVSHFKAAGLFDNKWFRWGGWMRIVTVVLTVAVIGFMFAAGGSRSLDAISASFLPIIPASIAGFLAVIFSVIAFFTLREEAVGPRRVPEYRREKGVETPLMYGRRAQTVTSHGGHVQETYTGVEESYRGEVPAKCPGCGAETIPGASFCGWCGRRLT